MSDIKYKFKLNCKRQVDHFIKQEDVIVHKNYFTRLITLGFVILLLTLAACAAKKSEWGDLRTGLILRYRLPQDQTH